MLVQGRISWEWMNVLFWRSFFCLVLHYLAILLTCSLSLKLGIIRQLQVDTRISDNFDRPSEDTATLFAFVKQQFYHRSLAYAQYEKNKGQRNRMGCCRRGEKEN